MLKAVVGLYACGEPLDAAELLILKDRIKGRGYTEYISKLLSYAR